MSNCSSAVLGDLYFKVCGRELPVILHHCFLLKQQMTFDLSIIDIMNKLDWILRQMFQNLTTDTHTWLIYLVFSQRIKHRRILSGTLSTTKHEKTKWKFEVSLWETFPRTAARSFMVYVPFEKCTHIRRILTFFTKFNLTFSNSQRSEEPRVG